MCAAAAVLLSFVLVQSKRTRILLPIVGFVLVAFDATIVYAKQVNPHFVAEIADKSHSGRDTRDCWSTHHGPGKAAICQQTLL